MRFIVQLVDAEIERAEWARVGMLDDFQRALKGAQASLAQIDTRMRQRPLPERGWTHRVPSVMLAALLAMVSAAALLYLAVSAITVWWGAR